LNAAKHPRIGEDKRAAGGEEHEMIVPLRRVTARLRAQFTAHAQVNPQRGPAAEAKDHLLRRGGR